MMNPVKAMITGAAGGLGSELAVQLARQKADLLLVDKASRALDHLSDQIMSEGLDEPGVCSLDFAIAGSEEYEKLVQLLIEEYGGLDVVIHCAAAFHGLQPMDQVSASHWLECMQVNVNAAWLLTNACLPLLKRSSQGRVVFIHDDQQVPESAYWGAYGVSKAALSSLGKILKEELDNSEVQVVNIYPGPMQTSLRARAYLAENPQSLQTAADAATAVLQKLSVLQATADQAAEDQATED
jgi:NAD(P)-dependent dehydrogenase (short-subunit alcohol dehydrogenase family)